MDKKKIVIVGLIVLAVLFFTGIGAGLVPNKGKSQSEDDYIKDLKKGDGWETTLGNWMAPLAPTLDIGPPLRLTTCKYKENTVTLSKTQNHCEIKIRQFYDDDYRKTKISTVKEVPGITVAYKPNDEKQDKQDEQEEEEEQTGESLTSNNSINVVVLKEGGTLTLRCSDECFKDDDDTVEVTFE